MTIYKRRDLAFGTGTNGVWKHYTYPSFEGLAMCTMVHFSDNKRRPSCGVRILYEATSHARYWNDIQPLPSNGLCKSQIKTNKHERENFCICHIYVDDGLHRFL
jgi:hypothetical protein